MYYTDNKMSIDITNSKLIYLWVFFSASISKPCPSFRNGEAIKCNVMNKNFKILSKCVIKNQITSLACVYKVYILQ